MPSPENYKNKTKKGRRKHGIWALYMFLITLFISFAQSILFQKAFSTTNNILLPLIIILIIILIGVIFDIIGIAVASAPKTPFVSMSSKKIRGSRQALNLIKSADLVSNFCNDVVGDICGIISGAAGSMLVFKIVYLKLNPDFSSIVISSIIAAITVGGKSIGKSLAINKSKEIIYSVGYLLSFFDVKNKKSRSNS
ncbi:MAG: hypothetical protein GX352_08720 [Clostridiales bacterium]|nr:hypothetical protein [Clostridiales bacterium]